MKALGYFEKHELESFAIRELELPEPAIGDGDLLVRVKAISTNPVDTKVRRGRGGENGKPVILGWDAAGVVEKIGRRVTGFAPGDEVFYAGDLTRDGSYAERQAVDARLAAHKPRRLDFAASAALPLTSLTAWEALLENPAFPYAAGTRILVIGGAGGVGSIATQLLKAKTSATVITTASRPETVDWARRHGADIVLDHRRGLAQELRAHGIDEVDVVFGTTQSAEYLPILPSIIRPFGRFVLIDDPDGLDISPFKRKSITVQWELMFTKAMFGYRPETQGAILTEVARLADEEKIRSTAGTVLRGFNADTLRQAHALQESGRAIGKIVIVFEGSEKP